MLNVKPLKLKVPFKKIYTIAIMCMDTVGCFLEFILYLGYILKPWAVSWKYKTFDKQFKDKCTLRISIFLYKCVLLLFKPDYSCLCKFLMILRCRLLPLCITSIKHQWLNQKNTTSIFLCSLDRCKAMFAKP